MKMHIYRLIVENAFARRRRQTRAFIRINNIAGNASLLN